MDKTSKDMTPKEIIDGIIEALERYPQIEYIRDKPENEQLGFIEKQPYIRRTIINS